MEVKEEKVQKEQYSILPNIEKKNNDFSYDEILLKHNDEKKRITKYLYCCVALIIFIFGYSLGYILNRVKNNNNGNNNFQSKNIKYKKAKKALNIPFLNEIQKEFDQNHKANINNIENRLGLSDPIPEHTVESTVHIAFTLDPGYILETMLTMSSISASQKKTTKIVYHLGVIDGFKAEYMLKMYELKDLVNNLTEFNFYYLSGAVEKMQNFHPKGAACPGKFELPELIPDEVERVLLFDGGDVLILRDLTELYDYDMGNKWILGPPEPGGIEFLKEYNKVKYINIGSILMNIKELKKNNFWNNYVKNRNIPSPGAPDQTLFNILCPDERIGFFPFRFGGITILKTDKSSDIFEFEPNNYENWLNSDLGKDFPENPKNHYKMIAQYYNSVFIHQFHGKWDQGSGLSIYRHLAKYFILIGGLWDELCVKRPGYCI